MQILLYLTSLLTLWAGCQGYYQYQTAIPNGQNVPHPCKPNFVWHGVGHLNPAGGGERNPFGRDFARLGLKWSVELCQLDSDGDGLTNGQELGDAHCVWTQGAIPQRTDNITHPGVCDPWGSQKCGAMNTWVTCDTGDFHCDAINATDVRNITLRFPRSKVPTAETSYMCFVFDLPTDQTYHLIANKPVIDNPNVMHHIALIACDDDAELMTQPQLCTNMGNVRCNKVIGIWTLGMTGECVHPDAGFRIGKGGYKRVALQFHWTNKHHVDSWYDASGMTLFFTPRLRPNDAGVLTIGQLDLYIPPGVASLTINGSCSSACTRKFMRSEMKIVAVLNHMHYLGVSGNIEQIRAKKVIGNLSPDHPYSYDSPHVYYYDNPVVVRPGDELKMVCEFSSLSRDVTTVDGPGSYNEMCFGLITFYPLSSLDSIDDCVQHKDFDYCQLKDKTAGYNINKLVNSSDPETAAMMDDVLEHCLPYGPCNKECPAVIDKYRLTNKCLNGTVWDLIKTRNLRGENNRTKLLRFIAAIDICDRAAAHQGSTSVTATTGLDCPNTQAVNTDTRQSSVQMDQLRPLETFLQLARDLGSRPLLQNIIFNANGNR